MSETVTIKINVNANTKAIEKVIAQLTALRATADALDKKMGKVNGSLDDTDKEMKKVSKSTNTSTKSMGSFNTQATKVERTMKKTKGEVSKFDKILQGFGKKMQGLIKFGFKGMLINIAALGAALLTVSGSFTVARLAMQAWRASLAVGAAAAASFISVLAGLAAGQRQYAAAVQASQYGGGQKGLYAANTQLRSLQKNSALAALGADAVNGAFAAISANTRLTGGLQAALTKLGDFAAGSLDPKKSLTGAGTFLGILDKDGKVSAKNLEAITKAAEDIGPAFLEAFNKSLKKGHTSEKSLLGDIMSGDIGKVASGQLDVINSTLFGTFKRNVELLKAQFADLGQGFLPDFTSTIERLGQILSTGLIRIQGSLTAFAKGNFLDTIVSGFEKIVRLGGNLFNKYLPKSQGMLKSLAGWGHSIADGFRKVGDALRPLLAGAGALKEAFGPLVKSFFTEFYGGMKSFNQLLINNKDQLVDFGESLKNLFVGISNLFGAVKEAIIAILPILSTIVDMFTNVVDLVTTIIEKLNGLGKGGSLAAIAAMIGGYIGLGQLGKARGGTGKGGILSRVGQAAGVTSTTTTATMNVTAGVVNMVGGMGGNIVPGNGGGVRSPWGPPTGAPGVPFMAGGAASSGRGAAFAKWAKASGALKMIGMMGAGVGLNYMLTGKSSETRQYGAIGAGAGIGTMIEPGLGTLIGAGAGATIGTLYNELYGNAKQDRQTAQAGAAGAAATTMDAIDKLLADGDYLGAQKLMDKYKKRSGQLSTIVGSGAVDKQGGGRWGWKNKLNTVRHLAQPGQVTGRDWTDITRNGAIQDMVTAGQITSDEGKALQADPEEFMKVYKEQAKIMQDEINPIIKQMTSNFEDLGKMTGMGDDAIQEFAHSIGVDLTQELTDVGKFIEKTLGGMSGIAQNAEDLQIRMTDAYLHAVDLATLNPIQRADTSAAVDQSGISLLEKAYSGVMTKADQASYIRDAVAFETAANTDATGKTDWMAVDRAMNAKIGKGGSMYGKGFLFEGQEDLLGKGFQPMLKDISKGAQKSYGLELVKMYADQVFQQTGKTFDITNIKGLDKMTPEKIKVMETLLSQPINLNDPGGKRTGLNALPILDIFSKPDQIDPSQPLADLGITFGQSAGEGLTTAAPIAGQSIKSKLVEGGTVVAGIIRATLSNFNPGSILGSLGGLFGGGGKKTPLSKDQKDDQDGSGDTASSRFNRTMGAHNRINGAIAGNRNITSGWRDTNLGSMSSDHVTGGALDLQGQGLGAYASAVKKSGGFAEFHGEGFDRHLHVVPGTGDTASPFSGAGSSGTMGGTTIVHVYPSAGMDEEALARKVARVIRAENRSVNERMN